MLVKYVEGLKVEKISYDFEDEGKVPKFSGEGRTITVEFDKFIFICCYVPNSGEGIFSPFSPLFFQCFEMIRMICRTCATGLPR